MSHEINEADGNIREIQRLRGLLALAEADAAAMLAQARRAHRIVTYNEAMEYVARLNAEHPGTALLAELTDLRAERDDLRHHFDAAVQRGDQFLVERNAYKAELAAAQAELDRRQPIVIAAAQLAAGPDAESWAALYAALGQTVFK